ncbi:23S rRNA (uracil(1939)-C(5))-methyltransferase RlmD [Bacillus sp. AFS002410]|uniref:23S rRNA (uracil(1939)-C(5))-methyltransferase RlmD n=1 Tax=Bacillus sp. AFS002410 TaxID=2033481 RepID=UPI000BF23562|nr:23S rRNA (uracil(1939)-C(5))-methyltransferase RlmD [Bacillus sp. AFS002410]PEJ59450.1 23S rRNA (uracil(1939)-C(5))-methyltransferase RlmD [Bacillus sp. AFS002410]
MSNQLENKLEVGQSFPITIKRIGINGEGVGYFKRQVVFIKGALPGEEVVAEVTNVRNGFAEGKIQRIRKSSPDRVDPTCKIYEKCGGCQIQHASYEGQLRYKRDIVIQAMEKYAKDLLEKTPIKETVGMENPWNYRNKSQLQTGLEKNKIIAGLYKQNSHEVVDIGHCPIQHEDLNKITGKVKKILTRLNIPVYNERKNKGVIRTIVARVGLQTGQIQLVLVTGTKDFPQKNELISEIKKRIPEVTSLMQNINNQMTSVIFGRETVYLAGEEVIEEKLGDLSFELSARAFFQLNPEQTVKLYDEVKKAAALTGTEKVVDAYCGVGTIGLWLAKDAKEVRGMDVTKEAIIDAKTNALSHGFTNTHYEAGNAEQVLPKWLKEGWKPDVIITDPPRTGCDEEFLNTVLKIKPKKLVYVSCNPSTLARDLKVLSKSYDVKYMQPVDMFPHTAHVEVVANLELKMSN